MSTKTRRHHRARRSFWIEWYVEAAEGYDLNSVINELFDTGVEGCAGSAIVNGLKLAHIDLVKSAPFPTGLRHSEAAKAHYTS